VWAVGGSLSVTGSAISGNKTYYPVLGSLITYIPHINLTIIRPFFEFAIRLLLLS
jgi:hypothetical protein